MIFRRPVRVRSRAGRGRPNWHSERVEDGRPPVPCHPNSEHPSTLAPETVHLLANPTQRAPPDLHSCRDEGDIVRLQKWGLLCPPQALSYMPSVEPRIPKINPAVFENFARSRSRCNMQSHQSRIPEKVDSLGVEPKLSSKPICHQRHVWLPLN